MPRTRINHLKASGPIPCEQYEAFSTTTYRSRGFAKIYDAVGEGFSRETFTHRVCASGRSRSPGKCLLSCWGGSLDVAFRLMAQACRRANPRSRTRSFVRRRDRGQRMGTQGMCRHLQICRGIDWVLQLGQHEIEGGCTPLSSSCAL